MIVIKSGEIHLKLSHRNLKEQCDRMYEYEW